MLHLSFFFFLVIFFYISMLFLITNKLKGSFCPRLTGTLPKAWLKGLNAMSLVCDKTCLAEQPTCAFKQEL